ncbi:rhodanese-like domain-containing protein [Crateriforma conspicua]|uniref:rhodanese-like domain-containing protein n=1 Tax=Crateriforma conspicua TaxID=2527996 RepID=UPI0018C89A47|nr:rhodanese-like domain-containing protein [Crateriforma conspicua]
MPDSDVPLEITVIQSQTAIKENPDVVLIDVREQDEFELARIQGAKLIPLSEFPSRIGELEPFRDRPIIVYCHHGVRSLHAVFVLRHSGFLNSSSMSGGIDLWSQQIDAEVPRY